MARTPGLIPRSRDSTSPGLAERAGVDPKAKGIPADRLHVSAAMLERLDRDGDGKVTPSDFDWSDQNPYVMQLGVVNRLFRHGPE